MLSTALLAASPTRTRDSPPGALDASGIRVLRGVEAPPAYRRGMNNTVTSRGLMRFLTVLADRAVVSPGSSDAMLEILLAQKFREGIPSGVPEGTPVAHKTGS